MLVFGSARPERDAIATANARVQTATTDVDFIAPPYARPVRYGKASFGVRTTLPDGRAVAAVLCALWGTLGSWLIAHAEYVCAMTSIAATAVHQRQARGCA